MYSSLSELVVSVTGEQFKAIKMGKELSEEQRAEVRDLVSSFADVFAKDMTELGQAEGLEHDIKLEAGTRPPVSRPYRVPPWKAEEIDKQMDEMLAQGITVPLSLPYTSPVVLAKKKGGEWRFCVDYRALNKATQRNQ